MNDGQLGNDCRKPIALIDLFDLEVSVCKLDSAGNDGGAVSIVASFAFQVRVAIEVQKPSFESLDR
jgi:hypothetical protein